MTEVDVVLPEGVAEPTNKLASETSSATAAADSEQDVTVDKKPISEKEEPSVQEVDAVSKQNLDNNSNDSEVHKTGKKDINEHVIAGSPKLSTAVEAAESMEVDGEGEEDSQITSSSAENGKKENKDKLQPHEDEDEEEATTNGDHEEDDELDKEATTAESSCEGDGEAETEADPLAVTANAAQASQPDEEMATEEDEVEEDSFSAPPKKSEDEESQQSDTVKSASDSDVVQDVETEEDERAVTDIQAAKKKETLNGYVAADSPNTDALSAEKTKQHKENGQASAAEAAQAASNVVNLDDDDSDEEEQEQANVAKNSLPPSTTAMTKPSALEAAKAPAPAPSTSSLDSSDDAVLIGSDSDTDTAHVTGKPSIISSPKKVAHSAVLSTLTSAPPLVPISKPLATSVALTAPLPMVDDDDDDDDCVVIEDDTPSSISPSELNKRKSAASDLEDLQHPSKRQRSNTPNTSTAGLGGGIGCGGSGIGQLTIKDARSLMPHEAPTVSSNARDAIYPVTITNAVTGAAANLGAVAAAKLMPLNAVAAAGANLSQLNPPTLSLTGLPSLTTNNANLLPGLTDDMFVLEAPSFIVPYIYEKPPNDNIREVIKQIETKYALSAEDLAEADKSDEFDMITEQNREDKPASDGGKKKKKRGDDESWSEQSDDDDDDEDDDDSESGVRTKVLIKEASDDLTALKGAIKPAAALAQSGGTPNAASKPGQENYFESPLGKFFMDIGVGLVQEYVQADLLRLQKRKMRKSLTRDPKDFELAINALSGNLQASKTKNAPFKFTMKRCEFCNFKSESALSMANHYETPHMNGVLYKCNFCTFEIRNATEIVYHMEAVHNIKARLIKPLPYHQCPNCGFEDNGKAKLARHQPVCAKKFRPELNLAPPNDWEAPAKIPRIKPRHGLVGTATAYQAMAAQAAAQKAALATIQQQQAQAQARNLQAAALAAQNAAAKMRARAPQLPKPQLPSGNTLVRNPAPVRNPVPNTAALSLPTNYQLAAGQLVQQASKKPIAGQPSISITPLPRPTAASSGGVGAATSSSSKMPQAAVGMKPGQSPSGNNKAQFVICEICDGYIKDLEQLRNHMQWMHKVKIHPKMIYNRPPLNCQKCQFRFFTDQGLERHLLGSHGLVTSSMQEAANKGKDAGRCPVCGRMYQWKLLNHVSRDHHMTLKPAHLSYKCTVCTATFGMYKQFETHVYTAHSTVAKKAMDSKKNSGQGSSSSTSSANLSRNLANDTLLKPLKINDEITIIPQPASKPRITNMESHVID